MVTRAEYLDAGSDRDLVARFQDGDEAAFVELVHNHYASLMSQARRRLRTLSDAEDAVQETLLRAYRALHRFGGDYQVRAWLGRILANVCNDVGNDRQAKNRLERRLAALRHDEPAADDSLPDEAVRRAVQDALTVLPSSYRRAFVLRDIEQRPYAEVASAMEITEVNARARVHRARSALQRSLRSVAGTLGVMLLPLPMGQRLAQMFGTQLSRHRQRFSGIPSSGASAQANASFGGTIGATPGAVPAMSQLAGLSQVATQAVATPAVQGVVGALPDVARTSVGAIATLAAASLAIVAPAAVNSGAGGTPRTDTAPIAAAPAPLPGDVAPASQAVVPTSSATTTDQSVSGADTSQASSGTGDQSGGSSWQWVQPAATSNSDSSTADQSTTDQTSGDQSSTTTSSGQDAGTSTGQAGGATTADAGPTCPWLESFPDEVPAPNPLPPSVFSGASAFISTGTTALATTGPVFSTTAPATLTDSGGILAVRALFAACMPGAQTQALVSNISIPGSSNGSEWQLRGAMVSSSASNGTTDAYYRGILVPIGGDASAGVPFVADVTVSEPANSVTLRIALFGDVPGLTDQTAPASSTSTAQAMAREAGTAPTQPTGTTSPEVTDPSATDPSGTTNTSTTSG